MKKQNKNHKNARFSDEKLKNKSLMKATIVNKQTNNITISLLIFYLYSLFDKIDTISFNY